MAFLRMLFLWLMLLPAGCISEHTLIPIVKDESFLAAGTAVDVMAVIDTSCSMADDWILISHNMSEFGEDLERQKIDWSIALTTMDIEETVWANEEIPFILLSDETNLEWEILIALQEVSKASFLGGEMGFAAAIERQSTHVDWFRPGTPLIILFIGDEQEQSDIDSLDFRAAWQQKLYVVSVVGPESKATEDPERFCSAEPAPLYWDASDIAINICNVQPWELYLQLRSLSGR